jgi:hypothetical protein
MAVESLPVLYVNPRGDVLAERNGERVEILRRAYAQRRTDRRAKLAERHGAGLMLAAIVGAAILVAMVLS